MSLVVLQKKSRRYKAPVSGIKEKGFSIVGGHRNQGWIGQDNLARHLIRTPFKGLEPMGYGGNNGKYLVSVLHGQCCTNDADIIKRSTMNTPGLFDTRVKHPTGVFHDDCGQGKCGKNWVKDFEPLNHSQSGHIKRIKVKTACNRCNKINDDTIIRNISCECRETSYFIGGKRYYKTRSQKDKIDTGVITMGEYIDIGVMQKNDLPTPENKKAFPLTLNHDGCDTNYTTPEEAIAAGELPTDWMMPKKKAKYHLVDIPTKNDATENDATENHGTENHTVENHAAENNVLHDEHNEDLIDLEHFASDDNYIIPYHATIDEEYLNEWLTNTAETDILYSVNPYL
tara:strand:- start:11873 stop:12898 length:1026 start_codon:yes stop_codon:yes gene_type:complete